MRLDTSEPFALNEEEPRIYGLLEAAFGTRAACHSECAGIDFDNDNRPENRLFPDSLDHTRRCLCGVFRLLH